MVNFSEVVALSRDAQLQQREREEQDLKFVQAVMEAVRHQVEAEGGSLTTQEDWTRLSESTTNAFTVHFPEGCNVEDVGITVAGYDGHTRKVFMVGPAGRSPEAAEVKDQAEATNLVMTYLLEVVREVQRLHNR